MANAAALINEGLWRKDRDFQRLPRLAQCTFCQILSSKDLDTAGVLTLHLDLLAKACDELTVEQIRADFAVLEAARFLFVDYDTDEILVRSYVRLVSGVSLKNNAWRSVPKNSRILASPKLRHELATELRRLRWREAVDLADEIDPLPTGSEPPSNPLPTGSGPDTPFEGGRNPHSQVPVPDLVSPNVVGSVGVQRTRPTCSKHATDGDDNCRACMRRRIWDDEHADEIAADDLERRRQARDAAATLRENCPRCEGTNTYDDAEGDTRKCDPHWVPYALRDRCGSTSLMGSPCDGEKDHAGKHWKSGPNNARFEWNAESLKREMARLGTGGT